jgi:hypothetical protein
VDEFKVDALTCAEAPTLPAAPPPEHPEEDLGGVAAYRLLRRLGGGGMGTVYEAEDPGGRRVAIKLLPSGNELTAEAVERFRREGRLASAISHPRCVFVLAADEHAGRPYIVMELMPGETLADLLHRRGPLPPGEAVEKIMDVLEGLREAHRLGVVHRDVKPSNCFLEADGRVKVGDFGLAKSLAADARLTGTGAFLGTPLFSSPEQVRGDPLGPQSDIYSLAATLYCLLAGKAPFQSGDAAATLARIAADSVPPLRSQRPEVAPGLERAILRGLERDRNKRWPNLDAFRRALLPYRPGVQDAAGPGERITAWLLDVTLLLISRYLLLQQAVPAAIRWYIEANPLTINWLAPALEVAPMAFWLLYFAVPEWLCGCTLGKWLFGLRVRSKSSPDPPDAWRILSRTASFYCLACSGWVSLALLRNLSPDSELLDFLTFLLTPFFAALGIVLVLSTARPGNGWRGLHEYLSGTRVIQLAKATQRVGRETTAFPLDDVVIRPQRLPGQVGSYRIRGALRWEALDRVLLGEDAALRRFVLVWMRPVETAPLGANRHACARPSRLRWLASGSENGWHWDAFLAPAGRPLTDVVAANGAQSWADAQLLLGDLAKELAAATHDGTLPPTLELSQVWILRDSGVLLLDMPPGAGDFAETNRGQTAQENALALLQKTAVLSLEGWPRPGARRVRAPLPEYTRAMFARLFGQSKPYTGVAEFRAAIEGLLHKPAAVTRRWQARRLALFASVCAFFLCSCPGQYFWSPLALTGPFTLAELSASTRRGKEILAELQAGITRDFTADAFDLDPLTRALAVYRLQWDLELRDRLLTQLEHDESDLQLRTEAGNWLNRTKYGKNFIATATENELRLEFSRRQGQGPAAASDFREQASRWVRKSENNSFRRKTSNFMTIPYAILFALCWPLVWGGSAALFRGGVTYILFGLSLVLWDGRRASRWLCAVRAFLAAAPPAALLMTSSLIEFRQWSSGRPSLEMIQLANALFWTGVGLMIAYALLAICFPRRTLHDRLVGTFVVPR